MSLLLTVLKGTDILTFNGKFTTNKKDISTYLFLMVTKEQGYFEVFIFDDKCESKEQGRFNFFTLVSASVRCLHI